MAEECIFYYYEAGYCCAEKKRKTGDASIDSDMVYNYCWGYHYEDCGLYKSRGSSSGGCFLTSACVEAKGLDDDCYELSTLRKFRDEYMTKLDCGKCEIAHYYSVAPLIVERIKSMSNAVEVFDKIYNELVLPCIRLIENSKLDAAHDAYRDYVMKLEKEYV